MEKDPKNPSRWRPAFICREIGTDSGKASLKQSILSTCNKRNDVWAEQVRRRVEGALSDLHAADARYHVDCKAKFLTDKHVSLAAGKGSEVEIDEAFKELIALMKSDQSRTWNSVELFQIYVELGGDKCLRETLVKQLIGRFGNDILILHSPGLANIVMFRESAMKCLRLVADTEDNIDENLDKLSRKIILDIKAVALDKRNYETEIDVDSCKEKISATLLALLSKLSPKLDKTLPAILIGSIVTSILKNYPTGLQIALGVKMGRARQLVELLHEFGISCTYDELLCFKRSAAIAATKDISLTGISDHTDGLVQVVVDNFDADISSQNGKLSTHSLAILVTQPDQQTNSTENPPKVMQRISKDEMSEPVDYNIDIHRYHGPTKPPMPINAAAKSVLPLKILCQQVISMQIATKQDFDFLSDIILEENIPEFNGYNTRLHRDQNKPPHMKTKAVYLPLIDMVPSHPDTMMTALTKAQHLTSQIGQEFVIFTCDLQLYKVAQEVKWAYPKRFENVILRLGGMHSLMSFIGAIGTLMADTGLSEVMSDTFGGVPKMLTGKKFPQNVRAMRLVAEEILRNVVQEHCPESHDELMSLLENASSESKTAKLWVDVFLKPVLIMMVYIRAEREADWCLHLAAYRQMLPYFFAAGHVNYARYGLCYLLAMESLPEPVLGSFLKGEHVMRHDRGIWNGIWSDMFIESTFMRYGHAPGGIIGITLKPETLKVWALSLHVCSQLEADMDTMTSHCVDSDTSVVRHKEERKARIGNDAKDRECIRNKLNSCIDPLQSQHHQHNVINVVSGEVASDEVNVHDAVRIGNDQMTQFAKNLPDGLYSTIHKNVITMSVTRKHIKVGQAKVFETSLIYSRVLGLQASGRDIDIKHVLSHELAPIPTALFDEFGDMRTAKSKSSLKNQLQVKVSERTTGAIDALVIDGSALLWIIQYPAVGLVKDYLSNIKLYITEKLENSDVYLVFDRYFDYSTKSTTRCARATGASRVYQLRTNTTLPPKKNLLTVTDNKKQLIQLICQDMLNDKTFHESTQTHKLVITGPDDTPTEINNMVLIARNDIATNHEEADNIIIQQVLACVGVDTSAKITVMCDDTDVFVLLLYYYYKTRMTNVVLMESPIKSRAVTDIAKTVEKHSSIIEELLPAHALSGCDTVAGCYGIGKGTAVKAVRAGLSLSLLGTLTSPFESVISQATGFMSFCYGQINCSGSMSDIRLHVWASKLERARRHRIFAAFLLRVSHLLKMSREHTFKQPCGVHWKTTILLN